MQIPYTKLAFALFLSALLILGSTYLMLPKLEVYAQATGCAVTEKDEPPKLDLTYMPSPAETGVRVERKLVTPTKVNGVWERLTTLPPQTKVFIDNSAKQGVEDQTFYYRVISFNADGDALAYSNEGCKTVKRLKQLPLSPTLVVS